MNLTKVRNELRAKREAMRRAGREGGDWQSYYDHELAKVEREHPSANGEEVWGKAKAELMDVITKGSDRLKPSIEDSDYGPDSLDTMDTQQLEILYRQTHIDIEDSEARLESIIQTHEQQKHKPGAGFANFFNTSAISAGRNYLLNKKKLLAAIEVRLKAPSKPESAVASISKEQKKAAQLEAVLREKERVLASASPDMRPYIERLYREKVDTIMDS